MRCAKALPILLKELWLYLLSGLAAIGSSSAAAMPSDPLRLYGQEIAFDVFRGGDKVGMHKVSFSKTSDREIRVDAHMALDVTFLTIPVYAFRYRSLATWRDGRLADLVARIDDDGEKSTIRATAGDRAFDVSGPKGAATWHNPLFPTNHWNAGVLSQSHVLNTLNGNISRVRIAAQGRERIRAQGRWIEATRYQYSGDIDTTVWYDDRGRWVKMRFSAKGGSIIDYQCIRCGLDTGGDAMAN
jgi:hypothetical protein